MQTSIQLRTIDYCLIIIFVFLLIVIGIWYAKKPSLIPTDPSKITSHAAQILQEGEWEEIISLPKLKNSKNIIFNKVQQGAEYFSNIWGLENLSIHNETLHIQYPEGSFAPSANPRGGAGFIYFPPELSRASHAILSYHLTFDENFEFIKGGKLPGLCSGDCPRGGANAQNGFSTRFMWRADGELEVYGYIPNMVSQMGQSIGRGMYRFEPGGSYKLSQEIIMNTSGNTDGTLRVYVDNIMVYENTQMMYQDLTPLFTDKILFSTFFGGGDDSWATPRDTSIEFSDFEIMWQ